MKRKDHWEGVYAGKGDLEVSWTQPNPQVSFSLITKICRAGGNVIDVGGGTSVLAGRLLDAGFSVAVLDLSSTALARAAQHLGQQAKRVRWVEADVTDRQLSLGTFDVWHDRAVFHFLTDPLDRAAYVALLERTVPSNGFAVIATFALDGPSECSGLEVHRYDPASLALEIGASFELCESMMESHMTPWGKPQSFQYSVFTRVG